MNPCLFCQIPKSDVIRESMLGYVIYDKFPVNPGHVLIIPKRHVASLFDLSQEELINLFDHIKRIKEDLDKSFKPDGYNVGVNCGEAAGQTIFHLHIHLIPRYKGDVEAPRGGVRNLKKPLVEY